MRVAGRGIHADGAVVIITGGARGIGAATAELFARRGAAVWIGDVDADEASRTAERIPGARSAHLDVTDRDSWDAFLDGMNAPPDVLVNNAGVMPLGPFEEQPPATADYILDVNTRGPLNGLRAVVPGMLARGRGHVVTVSSMAGMIPIPGMLTYNASKFGSLGASLAARREYAGTPVTFSAVLPAAVRTELTSGAPLGRGLPTVEPEDVARAVFGTLARPRARVSVPRWVAPGWAVVDALVPEPAQNLARRLIADRRALTSLDAGARRGYDERVRRQAGDRTAAGRTAQ